MSYDPTETGNQMAAQVETMGVPSKLESDLTKAERDGLCDLSLQIYGRKYAWQKILRKGVLEMKADGFKHVKYLTLDEVIKKMEDAIPKPPTEEAVPAEAPVE